ncbi:UDP-glucose/GDP-mannose dehydrogenase family protein [Microlunatus elymi]|uniref:UDP-glucose 6-dehydrogenase n=1 Tax=Microlunatus elymi TaxID=2596828 RepID=A0A516Q618_9ACTN|nr:UDP-glucose/GDP-mannose dehydrogenase family protein [Microlunatus elymi]
MRISVIGTGYLGTTHAAGMAEFGHEVIGVDVEPERVKLLNSGQAPMYEVNLDPLLERHTASGRLRFTTDYADIADWADVHFICVGTPQAPSGAADLAQINSVRDGLAPLLTKPTLIVNKSTVPVGTASALRQQIRALAPAGDAVDLAFNPEFLREGLAVEDTLRPDRIVLGIEDEVSLAILDQVYAIPFSEDTPRVITNFATAELIKNAANAFLATKISFINAMAQLCQATGGDVTQLADAIGYDKRIGRGMLNAGLGFGGGCIPKDIRALAYSADEHGVDVLSNLIESVEKINNGQRAEVTQLAVDQLGGSVDGKRVAVLGASFKPGTDDTRNSPALTVADQLHARGAEVIIFDPQAKLAPRENFTQVDTVEAAVRDADIVLHLTEWPEFRNLDPAALADLVKTKIIIDARLKLNPATWHVAGWKLVQLGRAATL